MDRFYQLMTDFSPSKKIDCQHLFLILDVNKNHFPKICFMSYFHLF